MEPFLAWAGKIIESILGSIDPATAALGLSLGAFGVGAYYLAKSMNLPEKLFAKIDISNVPILSDVARRLQKTAIGRFINSFVFGMEVDESSKVFTTPLDMAALIPIGKIAKAKKFKAALESEVLIEKRFGNILDKITDINGRPTYLTENRLSHIQERHFWPLEMKNKVSGINFRKFGYSSISEVNYIMKNAIKSGSAKREWNKVLGKWEWVYTHTDPIKGRMKIITNEYGVIITIHAVE